MKTRKPLKALGIIGVTASLAASPLAFAGMHDEPAQEPAEPATQPADPSVPADPGATTDPAAPADPAAPGATTDPGAPADEPGFGSGTEPMPSGQAEPGQDPLIEEDADEQDSDW